MPGRCWRVTAGGQIFIDVQLVGAVGTGNVYLTVFMEGVRRSRA
jgi:hypothetical protein